MQQRVSLPDLGVLRLQGPDAARFLQGQLSSDVMRLPGRPGQLAGYHNPQGRAIALLRLVQVAPDDILAVLPRELAAAVASRLSRFVLRAKVRISDASAEWQVSGISADAATSAPRTPAGAATAATTAATAATATTATTAAPSTSDGSWRMPFGSDGLHWLELTPAANGTPGSREEQSLQVWRRYEIAAGEPQIRAATSEEFVAQMLNLDALDAIAFDKGCYTGQEVIARAHYRGRVKRRMQRFQSDEPCQLAPGDSGRLADGRPFKVVQSVQLADGRSEFLAVTALETGEEGAKLARADSTVADSNAVAIATAQSTVADSTSGPVLKATALPLPYTLPD